MLATIRDDAWNVHNMQHITPNSTRWDGWLKDSSTWLKVATTLEKPPTLTHNHIQNKCRLIINWTVRNQFYQDFNHWWIYVSNDVCKCPPLSLDLIDVLMWLSRMSSGCSPWSIAEKNILIVWGWEISQKNSTKYLVWISNSLFNFNPSKFNIEVKWRANTLSQLMRYFNNTKIKYSRRTTWHYYNTYLKMSKKGLAKTTLQPDPTLQPQVCQLSLFFPWLQFLNKTKQWQITWDLCELIILTGTRPGWPPFPLNLVTGVHAKLNFLIRGIFWYSTVDSE